MLLMAAQLGADIFEAFVNSPPWHLTVSGSSRWVHACTGTGTGTVALTSIAILACQHTMLSGSALLFSHRAS
jgi:hypothetical protein